MGDKCKIQWTDASWNPVLGCRKVSDGCRNCYAMCVAWRMQHHPNPKVSDAYEGLARMTSHGPEWTGTARFIPGRLDQPLRWKRPRKIFVNSMSDLFHEDITNEQITAVFGVMAAAQQHTFQLLTKRPERMDVWFDDFLVAASASLDGCEWAGWNMMADAMSANGSDRNHAPILTPWPLSNVHLGVSIESRDHLDRIDILRQCPAAVRWLSLEPLLGELGDLDLTGIDWVVVGGESGPAARPMHPAWAREIRDQCAAQDVPFFFKQWGEWQPIDNMDYNPNDYDIYSIMLGHDGRQRRTWSVLDLRDLRGAGMARVGKRRAGRQLDGRTWDEMPGDLAVERAA